MRLKPFLWLILPMLFLSGVLLLTGCQTAPSSTASQAQRTVGKYQVQADLPAQGLKVREETYTLRVTDTSGQPVPGVTRVQVTMPMAGGPSMTAPTTLTPSSTPGTYTVKTEFTMAGDWTLSVKPNSNAEPVALALSVSES